MKKLNEIARIKHISIVQCGNGSNEFPHWWNIYQDGCNWPVKTHWNLGLAYQHMVRLTA